MISNSSSEWTRSLTIPDVVLDEVLDITEMRWSQSHLCFSSSSRRASLSRGATAMLKRCAALHSARSNLLFSSLLVYRVSFS
jgi:hypothetical protein